MPGTKPEPILLANLSKSWGGGEKWFFSVGHELHQRGHSIVMAVYPGSALAARVEAAGLPTMAVKARFSSLLNPLKVWRIYRQLKQTGPRVVVMNASHELKVIGLLSRLAGVPHVVFRRGVSYPLKRNPLNRWYIRHIATAFIANADATFEAFARAFPAIRHKPHITIYNGIDSGQWEPPAQPRQPNLIGISARLAHEKGIDRAIEALALLRQQGQQPQLRIIGEGPERQKLELMVKDKGLEEQVRFTGFVEDVRQALAPCSIFLFTPRYGEGTSLALIEAMLLEMPCVVFDTPSMKEVVVHGETGFVLPEGDVTALAHYLGLLLTDEALRLRMGKAGRKRAETHFTLKRVVDELEQWLGAGCR